MRGRDVALAAGAALAGLAAWATLVEPRWLKRVRREVRIPGLHAGLEGLRIALLTDLHAGRMTPVGVIRRAVAATMEAEPDLVAVTGDLADRRRRDLFEALEPLRELAAPLGVWAVPGNHDHAAAGRDGWERAVAAHPALRSLTNRCEIVERAGARICLAGVDDLEEGDPALVLPPTAQRDLTVLLAHQPDHAERHLDDGVDLVLAGHTHGGQIRLPGIGPLRRKSERYDEGPCRRKDVLVYTSRGIGTTLLPVRLGARPEVVVLELRGEGG